MTSNEPGLEGPVLMEYAEGIAHVALNRPKRHNSLNMELMRSLLNVVLDLNDKADISAVVLSGEGESFCSGLDVAEVMADPQNIEWLLGRLDGQCNNRVQHLAMGWRLLPVPVIAALQGHVYGGGLQIAMGADIRIAHPESRFSVMEGRWGIIPDMGLSVTARGRVREDRLLKMVLTAEVISGKEAFEVGLVTELCESPKELAEELAASLLDMSPDMIRAGKVLIRDSYSLQESERLFLEEKLQKVLLGSQNQMEAVMARLQKRKPKYNTD